MKLTAQAGSDIFIDGSALGVNGNIEGATLIAGDRIDMTVRGSMSADKVRGAHLNFVSNGGNLAFNDLVQTALPDGSQL